MSHRCRSELNWANRLLNFPTQGLPVIVLDDIAHRPDGCLVFIIAFRVNVMEGARRSGVTIRACEVNGNLRPSRGEMEDTY